MWQALLSPCVRILTSIDCLSFFAFCVSIPWYIRDHCAARGTGIGGGFWLQQVCVLSLHEHRKRFDDQFAARFTAQVLETVLRGRLRGVALLSPYKGQVRPCYISISL
jgi:hypothetical protein